jgi:hypothetical protein
VNSIKLNLAHANGGSTTHKRTISGVNRNGQLGSDDPSKRTNLERNPSAAEIED